MKAMKFLVSLAALVSLSMAVFAQDSVPESDVIVSHGLSSFGSLKYPADFTHFDYVNPDAPKGGSLIHTGAMATLTFDSFNPWILKGDA
jgi:microcin C transport system substrate-binding protein